MAGTGGRRRRQPGESGRLARESDDDGGQSPVEPPREIGRSGGLCGIL